MNATGARDGRRVAVITGASRGLGLAIAERLAQDDLDLVLTARSADQLEQATRAISRAPDQRVLAHSMDVSSPEHVRHLFDRLQVEFGRLDVLVCNAGVYGPLGPFEDVDWADWVRAMEINLYGIVLPCRAAVPMMRQAGKGKIIVLSGGGATKGLPRFSAYAASKAAVVRFAETIADELNGSGIDVNAIAPGSLNTQLLNEVLAAGAERVGLDFYERSLRQKAEGGTALHVPAELVSFLASRASDGITGRLIAAVWDDWRNLPKQLDRLARSDVYTLRRIVPEDRGWSTGSRD
jgi:NAD(P)-dependent dehydrogenase (short-subunit alcohol dehydrogenase family)